MALVVPLLLMLLFSSSSATPSISIAHAGVDDGLNYLVVAASSLKPDHVCQGHRVSPPAGNLTGSWVPLSRPHGPCSAAGAGSAAAPSVADTLLWDEHRAGYIQRKLASDDDGPQEQGDDLEPAKTEATQGEHSGTMENNFGTDKNTDAAEPEATGGGGRRLPGVTQTVVIDTSSDVPWVQCSPCPAPQCHRQTDVLYDPSKSGTYAAFPCSSLTCRQLGPYANGCTGAGNSGQCRYRVGYPDGSASSGTYISDVLTLTPTAAVNKFQFGCSHALQRPGRFSNRTAGIMALGHGPQSLASQTKGIYGHVFSYCLPPTANHRGFFVLGVPKVAASRYALTPMLRSSVAPMLYLVRLTAIDVAGQRLAVPPAVFAARAVMDSRTIITRLPPTAYMALRAAFRAQMRAYRAAPPKGQLDTCYDFTAVRGGGGVIRLPKITLVFDGRNAAVQLDPSGILLDSCLAFAPNSNDRIPGIIGNLQLQTLEVLYNVGGGTVGFRRGAC